MTADSLALNLIDVALEAALLVLLVVVARALRALFELLDNLRVELARAEVLVQELEPKGDEE